MNATPARTRRLLPWAGACLAVALACAVHAARLADHPASWFVYQVGDPVSFPVPGNPAVYRFGLAAIAAGGLGLLLLGGYLLGRVHHRSIE